MYLRIELNMKLPKFLTIQTTCILYLSQCAILRQSIPPSQSNLSSSPQSLFSQICNFGWKNITNIQKKQGCIYFDLITTFKLKQTPRCKINKISTITQRRITKLYEALFFFLSIIGEWLGGDGAHHFQVFLMHPPVIENQVHLVKPLKSNTSSCPKQVIIITNL